MRRSGEWGTGLRKKIKNSLSIKVFLWIFSALTISSLFIYGIVMSVLPQRYQFVSDKQLEENVYPFFNELEDLVYAKAVGRIYDFCIRNHAAAILSSEGEVLHFGSIESRELNLTTSSFATNLTFADRAEEATLVLISISQTADEIRLLFLRLLPVIFGVIVLVSALSAYICSRVIVAPIAKISQISRRMTSLDMTWRCEAAGGDEIGVLAGSLNTMAGRLQTVMNELENANRQLTADVQRFQVLEEQRRNFFAAVSHELKTPLTVLKGQIENMLLGYGDYQNHEKYLPQALRAAEEIETLVREILSISKMERMKLDETLEEVSLYSLIEYIIKNLEALAEEKNILIHQEPEQDIMLLVNKNLFAKALSNIIGNAVLHSPCGAEIFILVRTGEEGRMLTVENTGASIPEADLPYMFTPFYRADRSRSKATGGSGLGLYIVKTILDLHGMEYGIRNSEAGVEFYLKLPDR